MTQSDSHRLRDLEHPAITNAPPEEDGNVCQDCGQPIEVSEDETEPFEPSVRHQCAQDDDRDPVDEEYHAEYYRQMVIKQEEEGQL